MKDYKDAMLFLFLAYIFDTYQRLKMLCYFCFSIYLTHIKDYKDAMLFLFLAYIFDAYQRL